MTGKSAHMQLVNHGLDKRAREWQITLPIVPIGVGYNAFHRYGKIVAGTRRSRAVVCLGHGYGKPVRIEQHFLRVKPKSAVRIEGPVSPVSIHLARPKVRDKDMPVMIRAMLIGVERDDPRGLLSILIIEQEQLEQDRMLREQAEIDAVREDCRAERSAHTRSDSVGARGPHHAHLSSGTIGLTFQMSRQYSRIERSDEKRPARALLRMDMRVQAF